MNDSFVRELEEWGPAASRRIPVGLDEAHRYCRQLARTHYENFPVLTWLLPGRLRQHFCNIYAWCRWADDLGDEIGDPQRSLELLGWWRNELAECYAGRVRHPVFIALKETIVRFDVPKQPFEDLLSAFEQDQRVREYDTFDQLLDYCRRSANPVGRLVLQVCGRFDEANAELADSICTGLQLANFWQDVGRDFDMGRVYLPREDRRRFGYTPPDLAGRVTNGAFVALMRFQVDRARDYLRRGLPLAGRMPGRLQVVVELFARGGLKVLELIEADGCRLWERRPLVRKRHLIELFVRCAAKATWRRLARRNDAIRIRQKD